MPNNLTLGNISFLLPKNPFYCAFYIISKYLQPLPLFYLGNFLFIFPDENKEAYIINNIEKNHSLLGWVYIILFKLTLKFPLLIFPKISS